MKKLVSLLLALSLSAALAALALPALAADFTDVPPTHAFYDAVTDCAAKGIVGGYDDGTFRPGNTVTRSSFVVMLSRAFFAGDIAKYNKDSYNRDVYGPFAGNYLAAYYGGAFAGASFYEDFVMLRLDVMNTGINRYDMAQLMTNIMNARGFAASSAEKAAAANTIRDYASIPGQYQDAVANVYALGVIGGFADGKPITEENVTEILNQLQEKYPLKIDFSKGYAGLGSGRVSGKKCIKQVTDQYWAYQDHSQHTSTVHGCGGWAAFVADEIFGQTGVTWKKTSMRTPDPAT